jgi:hypothetical protein
MGLSRGGFPRTALVQGAREAQARLALFRGLPAGRRYQAGGERGPSRPKEPRALAPFSGRPPHGAEDHQQDNRC